MSKQSLVVYAAVTGIIEPSPIRYSQDAQDYYVNLLYIEPTFRKHKASRDVLSLRARTFEGLKELIADRCQRQNWPTPSFSTVQPAPAKGSVEEARANYLAEKKSLKTDSQTQAESLKSARAKLAKLKLPVGFNLERNNALSLGFSDSEFDALIGLSGKAEIPEEDKQEVLKERVLTFMRATPYLVQNPTFFTWGENQQNWQTLLAYFEAKNIELPTADELGRAFRFLSDSGCFHAQESYKRSETHLRPRAFDPSMLAAPSSTVTPAQLQAAKSKLFRLFGNMHLTPEKALQYVSQAELDAILNEQESAKAKDPAQLASEVKAGFKPSRGRTI